MGRGATTVAAQAVPTVHTVVISADASNSRFPPYALSSRLRTSRNHLKALGMSMRSIGKRTRDAFENTMKDFEKLLGRPMDDRDRIMYWSYTKSIKEIKDDTIRSMIAAGTPEHLIYIYDKT